MSTIADPVRATLLLPLIDETLPTGAGPVVFLNAASDPFLKKLPNLHCVQAYKPDHDALAADGYAVTPTITHAPASAKLVLIRLPRARGLARSLMAEAANLLAPDGLMIAAAANNEGARSAEADAAALFGAIDNRSKNKCRVFWSQPGNRQLDQALAAQWLADGAARATEAGFHSQPGLFAWDHPDRGSALLIEELPRNLTGVAADLGAGWGYIAREALAKCPGLSRIDLYEADHAAITLAEKNLAGSQARCIWHDVTAGLPERYDVILMNPPFHTGHADQPKLGQAFIKTAAAALKPGGRLILVANRHLPYEASLAALFGQQTVLADDGSYKVIEARDAKKIANAAPAAEGRTRR